MINFITNFLTRILIVGTLIGIIGIYYHIELVPFSYQYYENTINKLQRLDAELEESIVQSRFGLIKNYDITNETLDNIFAIVENLEEQLNKFPNTKIQDALDNYKVAIQDKRYFIYSFQLVNPMLINAINQFSNLMSGLIEEESNVGVIENCFEQEYHYQFINRVNRLFRSVLFYTNNPSELEQRRIISLIASLKDAPNKSKRLELALNYAAKITELQPKIIKVENSIFNTPLNSKLNNLFYAYKNADSKYLARSEEYRIALYILTFALLVVLMWSFSRLRRTIGKLNSEVIKKVKAQKQLAKTNAELETRVDERTQELVQKNQDLNEAIDNLHATQDQLVVQQKMASLGQLTTGIAHELKNPLNFVNNFSKLNIELLNEVEAELSKATLSQESKTEFNDILQNLISNSDKIKTHGERADKIIRTMLMHAEGSDTQRFSTNINSLVEDATKLALQQFREHNENIKINVEKYLAEIPNIDVVPKLITRVFIYVLENSLYTLNEKLSTQSFNPTIKISTSTHAEYIVITIRDNGLGIPQDKLSKVMEPFFTTKPTGKGNTGLGLSICYDTIVIQHQGKFEITSTEGEFTEVRISLLKT